VITGWPIVMPPWSQMWPSFA